MERDNVTQRILIVQAHSYLNGMLQRGQQWLRAAGFEVDLAKLADGASTSFGQDAYSLLILGSTCHDGPGFRLLKRLREDRNDVPVIIASSRSESDEKVSMFNAGADDYFVLPCDADELVARCRT
ncbi:response regulator transcription factor [Paraburkholderia diazotrophica]|nr:response regulator [Paraburkholderia diazotrophica]